MQGPAKTKFRLARFNENGCIPKNSLKNDNLISRNSLYLSQTRACRQIYKRIQKNLQQKEDRYVDISVDQKIDRQIDGNIGRSKDRQIDDPCVWISRISVFQAEKSLTLVKTTSQFTEYNLTSHIHIDRQILSYSDRFIETQRDTSR